MGAGGEDWLAVLSALEKGDRVALVKITNVITGFLARFRAYELRESWDDLVQEVLVALVRSARKGSIRERRAFISYTGTITRNKLTDWIHAQQKPGSADLLGDPEAAEPSADPSVLSREPRSPDVMLDLERALETLPEKERRVVEAVYIRGMSYEEASKELSMPLGTLKRFQTQGLRELRQKMGVAGR